MEKKFNEEDGMLLIRQMIEQAKGNFQTGDGKYFILWGYLVTITCLVHFASYTIGGLEMLKWSWAIWSACVIVGIPFTIYFIFKDYKRETVSTYIGNLYGRIWMGFGCCAFIIPFLINGRYGVFIYPATSLLYTYALFLSGSALRLKWMYIPIIICVACVILYKFVPYAYYPLLMAVMLTCGNIIPGHIINRKAKKDV